MSIDRRRFLSSTFGTTSALATAAGLTALSRAATGAPPPGTAPAPATAASPPVPPKPAVGAPAATAQSWAEIRNEFLLGHDYVHMALMLLASHPRAVRDAIDRHRRGLDENPVVYGLKNHESLEGEVRRAAADYLGAQPDEVALTGNTTTGLAMLYGGLPLRPRQEILTTTHDHYSTHESLRLRAVHTGAAVRKISLYAVPEKATADEIVSNLVRGIGPRTRAVAVTWVHSSTGVKLPIRRMADAIAGLNKKRAENDQVLLCVDGVHAFGVEQESVGELGCDFLVAGCHKWLFGPRGTGIVWGKPAAWKGHAGIIPCFEWPALEAWMHGQPPDALPPGPRTSPGGFHSFEHRWALSEAFRFHQKIGKARVTTRIHELADHCKQALAQIPKVRLRTPRAAELSAGITCFEIEGVPPKTAVDRLFERKIIASDSPYLASYVRLTPGLLNTPEEVDRAVAAVKAVAG